MEYMTKGELRTVELVGGRDRVRTCDPLLAKQVLSQLSYTPTTSLLYITNYGSALRWFERCSLRNRAFGLGLKVGVDVGDDPRAVQLR